MSAGNCVSLTRVHLPCPHLPAPARTCQALARTVGTGHCTYLHYHTARLALQELTVLNPPFLPLRFSLPPPPPPRCTDPETDPETDPDPSLSPPTRLPTCLPKRTTLNSRHMHGQDAQLRAPPKPPKV
ncbi:hypothetical protein E4U53_007000 [Claviceps sorghi]|nr:hypothetical protein E4U53_007000 [Claviceps sorghi]